MTTRSGTSYKKTSLMAQEEGAGGVNMAQMLQVLLADREQREEERREERRRHDEEMARREHEMRQQMELLRGLVEGVNRQGEAALMKLEKDPGVRVTKLTEDDDIEAYLTTFERLMAAYEVKRLGFCPLSFFVSSASGDSSSVNCRLRFGAGGCSSLLAKFMSTFGVVGPRPDEGVLIEKVACRLRFDRRPVDPGGEIGG